MFNGGYGSIPKLHFSACGNTVGKRIYASCSTVARLPSYTLAHAVIIVGRRMLHFQQWLG